MPSDQPSKPLEIAEMILRHAGTTVRDHAPVGNRQFVDNVHGVGGPKRSCGICLQHRSPLGGGKSVRHGGWVCAGCKPARAG
jgi:hypothetical protein